MVKPDKLPPVQLESHMGLPVGGLAALLLVHLPVDTPEKAAANGPGTCAPAPRGWNSCFWLGPAPTIVAIWGVNRG